MSDNQELFPGPVLDVNEDPNIRRHEIAHRLTSVERRLMTYLAHHRHLITCVGNIGVGKSSLVKMLAYSTGMNALFELPDDGFEDLIVGNESVQPLLATAKSSAKRTLGRYYTAINEFIECQSRESSNSPIFLAARKNLERAALDIQHAYLDLRRMQLLAVPYLSGSTCVDGSPYADRYAFCEVLHNDMDIPYLTEADLKVIDDRIHNEFVNLVQPSLMILVHGPIEMLFENIRERRRCEEGGGDDNGLPPGLVRLVRALQSRYENFVETLRSTGSYNGPVLRIDVSRIDFVSNVRHLIAVYEGIERLLVPQAFKKEAL